MEPTIAECHDSCEKAFEELILAATEPTRDFGDQLTLPSIKEEYGRFKVWRGNVGAQHHPSRRISLDYRLRESKFYRDKIVHHLLDLSEALIQTTQLVNGDRLPVEECISPTESSVVSDEDEEDEEDETDEDEEDDEDELPHRRRSSAAMSDNFATLQNLLGTPDSLDMDHSVSFADDDGGDEASVLEYDEEPEIVQLRSAIADILAHLYKLSMLIRRPVPQDRLTRSAKIDVSHFEMFDEGYVQDCFPSARPWLQKRLGKAITRRRQHLIYNRKHHEHLAKPRAPVRVNSLNTMTHGRQDTFTAPSTILNGEYPLALADSRAGYTAIPASTRFATTVATDFVQPKQLEDETAQGIDWEAGTQSSYASTLGGKDVICIPPRPTDAEGMEMTQFECSYCFRIQEISSTRAWRKHVLTDLAPYVCTFEQCSKAETMFESRSEWYTHELQFHRREWACGEPNHKVYSKRYDFESHVRQRHDDLPENLRQTYIKSCERPVHAEAIECPLCTEDHIIMGNETEEPTIRRDPTYVPAKIFKRHLGRHLERLGLFAISSTQEETEEEGSLPSNNLNSGASQLSWVDEDLSSNSAEDTTNDKTTDFMEKLANLPRAHVKHSAPASSSPDALPPELQPVTEPTNIKLPCRFVRPHTRNPNFVGREDTFAKMQRALNPQGRESPRTHRLIFALCGSGGVGKSQTALNYVFEEMEMFQVVLFAPASSQTQLIHCFSNFAVELGLISAETGQEEDPTGNADLLKAWFNEAEVPWLLVIDSADNLDGLDEYVPTGRYGSILITSRNASLISKYGGMILGTLSEENAVRLLLESMKRQGWTENDEDGKNGAAIGVARRLGCFPLAITEAAHYIASREDKGLSDFIADYEQNELAHAISNPPSKSKAAEDRPFKLSIVWNMSYSSLTTDQQTLLNTISFFDPTGIPLDLISTGATKARGVGSETLEFLKNSQRFRRCKTALTRSSLVMQNENAGQLWMHQLYQESAQARMKFEERQKSWDRALALLDAMWPVADRKKMRRPDLWPKQTKYLPHVQSLAHWYRFYSTRNNPLKVDHRFAQLLVQSASFCLMRGFFEPVDSLLHIVELYCSRCDANCELLLFESYWAKGGTQLQLNLFEEGKASFDEAYNVLQRAVEKGIITANDDRIAIACGLKGNGFMAVNKFVEAEDWYLRAFHMWDTMDDNVFEDKQLFKSNIAVCLLHQNKLYEAEELVLHSLKERTDLESFQLGDSLYALGNIRIYQKDLERAFSNFKEAYTILKDDLGERHRLTANCSYGLGWIYNVQRKHKSAISMFEQALAAYEENSYFRNECARTKYMLGTIQLEHDDAVAGQANLDAAREMLKEIKPGVDVMEWKENDYDQLVMPWSR